MTKTFTQLGIQCAKKMDVTEALQLRRKYNVDPFGGKSRFLHEPNGFWLICVLFLKFQEDLSINRRHTICMLFAYVSKPFFKMLKLDCLTIHCSRWCRSLYRIRNRRMIWVSINWAALVVQRTAISKLFCYAERWGIFFLGPLAWAYRG